MKINKYGNSIVILLGTILLLTSTYLFYSQFQLNKSDKFYTNGIKLVDKKDFINAQENFKKASSALRWVFFNKKKPRINLKLALCYSHTQETHKAEQLLNALLRHKNLGMDIKVMKGDIKVVMGDLALAQNLLDEAVQEYKEAFYSNEFYDRAEKAKAGLTIARLYLNIGQPEVAMEFLKSIIDESTESDLYNNASRIYKEEFLPTALFWAASLYKEANDLQQAKTYMERAIEILDPNKYSEFVEIIYSELATLFPEEYNITNSKIPSAFRENLKERYELAVQSTLRIMATAAETFATLNQGSYPNSIDDLLTATPPYLAENHCNREHLGYIYECFFQPDKYEIHAFPILHGFQSYKSFGISTGGILNEI